MKVVRTIILVVTAFCLIVPALRTEAGSGDAKSPSLEGTWLGTLKVTPTASLRLVFNIQAKPDGSFSGTLDSLDQGATGLPISRIGVEKDKVTVEASTIGSRYEGTMNAEGSEISGKWTQGPASRDLLLERVKEAPKPKEFKRPQDPKRPYPYRDEEVTYRNAKDGVTLAGTLTMPSTGGPFPTVLLITGSGAQDRDETVWGHRPFLVLADYLTRRGIAVLRVDDRGVGGSKGDTAQATSEDFARDVLAGVEYLKTRKEIDPRRIGLIGHSEGGTIAPMVTVQSPDVAFIVLMAGTGVTGERVREGQIVAGLKIAGDDQARIEAALQSQRRIVEIVKQEADPELRKQKVRKAIEDDVAKLDEAKRQAISSSAYVDTQVATASSQGFRFFILYDPATALRKVKCPVLAINGELDTQVVAKENLPAIERALREAGNTRSTVKELPGLNHLFQTAKTGAADEYAQIEETMSPLALETIGGWLAAQGAAAVVE
ncbi:MAG: alpha/beta fold hydrolase [Sedimentisphaerales bacterium]|jgi:pimeloyl-ACP methyl ester carboxylesterase|nr:alpha/beta fold hydrolase [Sedimentisphaerales bacterium]NLX07923.1 alpha/beta fold hydrolase [Phycisphaerae bacterium]HNY78612.1 alpha/beta fold hydrolase [Sedimentisphaerales bacterium]HOC64276.1 alpha/beta fold hydrolase [Sedimentisphaerales bacterium]HOH64594.1 alpha/beta fold hydrolase [Sedimentisphaerales bacterium]